jgi:hypothetical protein
MFYVLAVPLSHEQAMDDDILFSLFHDIGPRPSPIAVVQHSVPSNPNLQLLLCLFIDFIGGNLSYLIPLLGESFDLAWAPFQALLMGAMFDSTIPSAKWHVHPPQIPQQAFPRRDLFFSTNMSKRCRDGMRHQHKQHSKYRISSSEIATCPTS